METRTIEVTDRDLVELRSACLGRITVLRQLIKTTRNPDARDELHDRLNRTIDLHDRILQRQS